MIGTLRAALVATLLVSAPAAAQEDVTFFNIGSGDIDAGYYSTAWAICSIVNRANAGRLRCSPEPSRGSIYNLTALARGDVEVAIVQSDWQHHAYEGTSVFAKDGPMRELRAIASLYVEAVTILATPQSGATRFVDLIGKRVDIGHPSSGRRATAAVLLAEAGIGPEAFAQTFELQSGSILEALCARQIDASILVAGHPSRVVAQALQVCGAHLAEITGPAVERRTEDLPYFVLTSIPADMYPSVSTTVATVGVVATVVTRADVPDAAVEAVLAAIMSDTVPATNLAAAMPTRMERGMMRDFGRTAPLHEAAERAYERLGIE